MKALKIILRIFSVLMVCTFGSGLFFLANDQDYLETARYEFTSDKLPSGYSKRIVALSDWHNHSLDYWQSKNLIEEVDKTEPDILVSLGDLVDDHSTDEDFSRIDSSFEHFATKGYPIYYVDGNHEALAKPVEYGTKIHEILAKHGAKALENVSSTDKVFMGKTVAIDSNLTITGLTDEGYTVDDKFYFIEQFGNVKKQLSSLDDGLSSSTYNVILSHRPENWKLIKNHAYDLTLSGHTHGGQVRLFGHGVLSWNSFKGTPVSGLYQEKSSSIVVSNGLGKAYGAPVRYDCPAQIVVIDIKGQ